mgnify:FL=1
MATFKLQSGGGQSADGEKKSYPAITPDFYDVEVVKVELRDKPDWAIRDPEVTKEVSFQFRILNGEFARRMMWGNAAPFFNYSPKCRLRIWVQGILGVDELPEDYELDLDSLAGKKCRILVGNRENNKGETKDFVQDVFQAKKYEDANAIFG